ncbi:MAG: magnesium transporter [Phycisphaeraceae bacterium]|nr:magnesium transporter [Phycisphaeraceae bacterium]
MADTEKDHFVGELLGPDIGDLIRNKENRAARSALIELMEPEIADALMAMEPPIRAVAFRLLPRDRQADVFVLLPEEQQEQLLNDLNTEQIVHLINEMEPDDRATLLEEMPGQLVAKLMGLMRPEERRQTQTILGYPPESVGRLMTPDYLTVRPDWTCQKAMEHIRKRGPEIESIDTVYVTDGRGSLVDDVGLRQIVLADPEQTIESLMDGMAPSLKATDDREEAVRAMERYDVPAIPVVDRDNVLVGIVTFDDVADVAEEEVTEDFHKMGGVAVLDQPYMASSVIHLVRKRVGWLAILFGAGLFTVVAMQGYEERIEEMTVLALFVPLIIATGGNSGFQAATVMTRAFAVKDVEPHHWKRVFGREMGGGLMLGLLLAILGFLLGTGVGIWHYWGQEELIAQAIRVGIAIAASIIAVVLMGNMIGSMLPFGLQRLGADPATSSTPFVATIVDVVGLVIYFTIASAILMW